MVEELYCKTTGCNKHDFKINAGGVCAYVDFMWLQEQKLKITSPKQLEFKGFEELVQIHKGLLSEEEVVERTNFYAQEDVPKPPSRRLKSSNGGGVPL